MPETFLKITNKFDFTKFRKKNKVMFKLALKKGAIAMLDWSANGSSKVPDMPPIRKGILKGSGSAFAGGELVDTTAVKNAPSEGTPTPAKSFPGANKNTITIVYNTNYAARMHQDNGLNPGDFSKRAGNSNPGNQWLQKHLSGDGSLLMATIGKMMKSELN